MSIKQRRYLRTALATALLGVAAMFITDATGKGVVTIMKSKELPEATLSVIDPEGGSSSGTAGSEVNLAAGDIIVFRFAVTPAPDGIPFGINHYLTEYVPSNIEVVGVRLTDDDGNTIKPNLPGPAYDACDGTGQGCNDFTSVPCVNGNCDLSAVNGVSDGGEGSLAQVYADTGVFYTFDDRLKRTPGNTFLQLTSGDPDLELDPSSGGANAPGEVFPQFDVTLGISSTWYAHNEWDYLQADGLGNGDSETGGRGNTPHLWGSPVAGSGAGYPYEVFEGANLDDGLFLDGSDQPVQGPWLRAQYPGSHIAEVATPSGANTITRSIADASNSGTDITPNNPLVPPTPSDRAAIRVATGSLAVGRPVFVEVAGRVTSDFTSSLVIDDDLNANANCGEIFGGGGREDTVWTYFAPSPQCVILRAVIDVKANDPLAPGANEFVTFDVTVRNLAVETDTNVVLNVQNNLGNAMSYSGDLTNGEVTLDPACDVIDTSAECDTFSVGNLAPNEEVNFTITVQSGGLGQEALFVKVNYTSDGSGGNVPALPPPGFTSQDVTQTRLIGVPVETVLWNERITPGEVASPGTATFSGALSNEGVDSLTYDGVIWHLPTGWSVNSMTVGGNPASCTGTTTVTCDFSQALSEPGAGTSSVNFSLSVDVPSGQTQGVYTIDAEWEVTANQAGVVYDRDFAEVSVGADRTAKPELDCPINSSGTTITGTAVPGSTVRLYINLVERGSTTADVDGNWSIDVSGTFGELYAGLEIFATAEDTAGNLNVSQYSDECPGGVTTTRQCSDGIDNDSDGRTDFPADPGCTSPTDNTEDSAAQTPACAIAEAVADVFGQDADCHGPDDEDDTFEDHCTDGVDNDDDGHCDTGSCSDGQGGTLPPDDDCSVVTDPEYQSERDYVACNNGVDDDGDNLIDYQSDYDNDPDTADVYMADPGCHSEFDDDETDLPDAAAGSTVKPRILVVFDTSGSMNNLVCTDDFTGGDGSFECPGSDDGLGSPAACTCGGVDSCGNGIADDSRLYKVKEGISDVVSAFGEVEYGLMRFEQRPQEFGCPGTDGNFGAGAWLGGGVAGDTECFPFNRGEMVVDFARDNVQTFLTWLDHESNYPGDPLGAPYGLDWELRGTGSTPLAGALGTALSEIQALRASDDAAACRPYRVILVTDGLESCDGDPAAAAGALNAENVPVTVIGFGDPALKDGLDAIASQGGTDEAVVVSDSATLSNELATVVSESIVKELCDGIDNDCDDLIDEDYDIGTSFACDNGATPSPTNDACFQAGDYRCDPNDNEARLCCDTPVAENDSTANELESNVCQTPIQPPPNDDEICDSIDNDCDLKIDEGLAGCEPEICDGVDQDSDGTVDERPNSGQDPLPGEGGVCQEAVGECSEGITTCCTAVEVDAGGYPGCESSADFGNFFCLRSDGPEPENDLQTDCDGLDNDCDGQTDEVYTECFDGTTIECPSGQSCNGICRRGVQGCLQQGEQGYPGVDPSCEGQVLPESETCNFVDDDCDGSVDEGFNLGNACQGGGTCPQTGVWVCDTQTGTAVCTAADRDAQAEVCDDFDNDCDGEVDEVAPGTQLVFQDERDYLGSPVGDSCTSTSCGQGELTCVDGAILCVGSTAATQEACNALDDDCDGSTDEAFPEDGTNCTPAGTAPDGRTYEEIGDTGECEFGQTICVCPSAGTDPNTDDEIPANCEYEGVYCDATGCTGTEQFACQGYKGPQAEVCDGLDNDCDGNTDEGGDLCTGTDVCLEGTCVSECEPGEFPCPTGLFCKTIENEGNYCVPDPCAEIDCEEGFVCESETGTCRDLCGDVTCAPGTVCQNGFCLDCRSLGCGENEFCRLSDEGIYQCEEDLCANVECDTAGGEFCVEGECRTLECDPECSDGERCVNGECQDDLCAGVTCPNGRICNPNDGECVLADQCEDIVCRDGQVCDPFTGDCINDPCEGITCPAGTQCYPEGPANAVCDQPRGERVYAGGGGGCNAGGQSAPTTAMLAMLGLFGLVRRRRQRARVRR